jgi:small subunit ribosomal protein S13
MPRIAGVDIPRNKQIWVSLQYIYGIGSTLSQRILTQAGVSHNTKADSLTEDEVNRLRELIDREYKVGGELKKEVNLNIKRLIEIGQQTQTNARTKRGPRKTVAGRGQRRGMAKK